MQFVHVSYKCIDFRNVVAVFRLGSKVGTHLIVTFPVSIQGFHQLCHGVFLFIKDELLDRVKTISGIDCADCAQHGTILKLEAAVEHIFSDLYAVFHQAGTEDIRE